MNFIYSIQSEWIKTKRSAASWLCLIGGFFIPTIYLIKFLVDKNTINNYPIGNWQILILQAWQNMAIFLLPMGVILASSLITQIEYKNNTWKQVHASPRSYTNIFFAKFTVIILLTIKFFVFFTIGIILAGIIPSLIIDHQFPNQSIPLLFILKISGKIFIACLPILAIQYLISLHFKNFLIPIGFGLLGLIGSLIGITWKYIFISPYSYCPLMVLNSNPSNNIYYYALAYFALLMVIAFYLYRTKKEKG